MVASTRVDDMALCVQIVQASENTPKQGFENVRGDKAVRTDLPTQHPERLAERLKGQAEMCPPRALDLKRVEHPSDILLALVQCPPGAYVLGDFELLLRGHAGHGRAVCDFQRHVALLAPGPPRFYPGKPNRRHTAPSEL